MGLFSKKKEEKKELSKFPQFHEEFPKYESTISSEDISMIKDAIKPEEKPPVPQKMTFATIPLKDDLKMPVQRNPYLEHQKTQFADMPKMPYIEEPALSFSEPNEVHKQEKTLFVKIDKYKEAAEKIENIKYQLDEVSKVISKINSLKEEEDSEVNYCSTEINKIKDSITNIDKILFGK